MNHTNRHDPRRSPAARRRALALAAALAVGGPWGHAELAAGQEAAAPPAEALPAGDSPAPARNGNADNDGDGGPGVTRQNGGLVLNFRDANIDAVLDELSAAAGLAIVRQVRPEGRVTLTSRQPVSPADAVRLLDTVLNNAGYAAIKQGNVVKIVDLESAKTLAIPVRTGSDPAQIEQTDELITQVIPLRYADATQLLEDLGPLINEDTPFAANDSSNALVITDTSANVRRVVEIINALDQSLAESVEVRVFQLEYAAASTTAQLINTIFGNLQVGGGSTVQEQVNEAINRRFRRGRGGGDDDDQGRGTRGSNVNAAADERTNSVVVSGPGDTLELVAGVVREIDSNPVADEEVFVYRLRNSQAINLEGVINNLFGNASTVGNADPNSAFSNPLLNFRSGRGGSTLGGGTSTIGGQGRFGGTTNTNRQRQQQQQQGRNVSQQARQSAAGLAGEVSIIADTDTNSLLVRTSRQNYERVKEVLDELDKPVAQVLIKVLIAEVTHDDSVDLGAELSVLNLRASGLGQRAGTSFNVPAAPPTGTGLVVQILESDFTAVVRALETEGKLDVLSRPYILASDNQVASITVGQEVPFITNSRITDEGGIINTIEYGDIGILLDVIPHVNPDGLVILDVAPEISTLTGTTVPISELVSAPVIAKRSAISRVGVANGQTIVIGGLMEDRKTQTISKVPLLGDIPGLGVLFRRTDIRKAKTELLIFLTPHVASDPENLTEMGDRELEGTQLVPNAVDEGKFQEQMEGMQRGRTAPEPAIVPEAELAPPTDDPPIEELTDVPEMQRIEERPGAEVDPPPTATPGRDSGRPRPTPRRGGRR